MSTTSALPSPGRAHRPLSPYDNNNEANAHKMKQQQQHLRSASNGGSSTGGSHANSASTVAMGQSASGAASGGNSSQRRRRGERRDEPMRGTACARAHLNSLWSVWYGFFGTFMQAYTAVKCLKRFLRYSVLPWTSVEAVWELHTCMLVTCFAVMLLPFFLASSIFKIGNYANDGYKIGRGVPSVGGRGAEFFLGTGSCNSLWRHAGPTAAFLHLVIAFCLLVPKLVMEARLVEYGFLPSDALWRTDLDFMVVHHDRLVVLSFMTAASPGTTNLTSSSNLIASTASPGGPVQGMMNSAISAAALVVNGSMGNVQEATSPKSLAMDILNYIRDFFKNDSDNDLDLDAHVDSGFGSSVSVEFMNYALALIVYSVRYPAVFWSTNKCFGVIFSLQLLVNSIQTLLSFAGMSVLYKVQLIGAWKALPLLRHYPDGVSFLGGHAPFLLNPHVTLALFTLSNMLILASSLILYLYGHSRFNAFLNQHRDKQRHIFADSRQPPSSSDSFYDADSPSWGYLTHCAALCALIATAVTNAPLLHDYTVVYRGSLDGAVLACVIAAIGHLFLWVLVWLFLTIKHKWTFKIRITVGRATVRSARSVRLITDVELASRRTAAAMAASSRRRRRHDDDEHPSSGGSGSGNSGNDICASQPLLVVGNGRAYAVTETTSRKAIMSVVQKAASAERNRDDGKILPAGGPGSSSASAGGSETAEEDNEEQIYWLRPAVATPHQSPDSSNEDRLCWFSSNKKPPSQHGKHKVTFNEATSTSNIRNNKNGFAKAKLRGAPGNGGPDEDDGDYATLRELPLLPSMMPDPEDDNTSEEGKLLACVHDDNVTYASTSRDLIPPADYEDPSPLLTPEPLSDRDEPGASGKTNAVNATVHNNHTQITVVQTPRCLRRADSGMPHEELTPRSDSISTESSTSPPDPPGSNNSETSSGVHSNTSSDHHQQPLQIENQHLSHVTSRRATSVADLVQQKEAENQWKSSSLTRSIQPPNGVYNYTNGSVIGYTTQPVIQAPQQPNNPIIETVPTVQTIVVQRTSQQPVSSGGIYGYTTAPGVITDGVETMVVRTATTSVQFQPSCSNSTQGLYGYTTKVPNSLENGLQPVVIKQNPTSPASSIYGYTIAKPQTTEVVADHGGIPAVILENNTENTVVIRRKSIKPVVIDNQQIPVIKEEPFGRSTNMRMTSFTEQNDLKNIQASSATLPHYPTQPVPSQGQYPHCSTMPLPHNNVQPSTPPNLGAGTSCNVYPRQHSTIPTHHNGVRLFPTNQNPYVKRVQNFQNGSARMNGTADGIYGSSGNGKASGENMYHFNS